MNSSSCAAWTKGRPRRKSVRMLSSTMCGYGEDNRERWVMHKWIQVSRKWRILTYCRRNVSVGRVIGIHIGRVMGGREHSVVVDSECWTRTMEKNSDSHLQKTQQNSERGTTGGTWCAGMRRSDAELSAQWQHSKTFGSFPLNMRIFLNSEWLHTSDSSLYPIPLQVYNLHWPI